MTESHLVTAHLKLGDIQRCILVRGALDVSELSLISSVIIVNVERELN
jgi:hypothetical protein